MRRWWDPGWRWAIRLAVLVLILSLIHMAWGNLELYRQRAERAARLQKAIAAEQMRATRLAEQARYVRSEEFVARWARVEAGMVRPQETPYRVARLPAPSTPQPLRTPTPAPWQAWWRLLQGH